MDSLGAVGATGRTSARFWMRTDRPGLFEVELRGDGRERKQRFEIPLSNDTDLTESLLVQGLIPGTRYRWAIRRDDDGSFLGEGFFETAPEAEEAAPDSFSLAVMSGHQPFDEHGVVDPERLAMLRAAERAFERHGVKRVLMLGNQIYADQPERCSLFDPRWFRMVGPRSRASLFDCTRQEVRRLYHERYRAFWSAPELAAIVARWPCYPMIDDREVASDFGDRIEHSSAIWRSVREGALDAAYDYQALFVRERGARPSSLHFQLEYGPAAIFMMDVRSERGWFGGRHQICSETQYAELAAFLETNLDRPVIILGMSVPFGFDAGLTKREREALFALLTEHRRRRPEQRLILLGANGLGLVNRITWDDGSCPPCHQLITGGVSNARHLGRLRYREDVRFPGATFEALHRPYHRLCLGVVKLQRRDRRWSVRLILLGHDASEPPSARTVFDSGPI